MERPTNSPLLDRHGQPLSEPIQHVLRTLIPRFRRTYPAIDDLALTDVLEEAGQRLAAREATRGPIRGLRAYAWKTLRSVAVSMLRRSEMRVSRATVRTKASEGVIPWLRADVGSPERIEREILVREILGLLTPDERLICMLKTAGYSAREIGVRLGRSATAVNVAFWRAGRKIRRASVSWRRRATDDRDNTPGERPEVRERPPLGQADD